MLSKKWEHARGQQKQQKNLAIPFQELIKCYQFGLLVVVILGVVSCPVRCAQLVKIVVLVMKVNEIEEIYSFRRRTHIL